MCVHATHLFVCVNIGHLERHTCYCYCSGARPPKLQMLAAAAASCWLRCWTISLNDTYNSGIFSVIGGRMLVWTLPSSEAKLWCMFVLECVCFNVYPCMGVCFSCVGHPMGTKRAVCAPSGAEMYTSDNRRLQSFSIGAALLIVPHTQWAFLSLSVFLSVSFSLYDHIQTVFLMRDCRNLILTDAPLCLISPQITISRDIRPEWKQGSSRLGFLVSPFGGFGRAQSCREWMQVMAEGELITASAGVPPACMVVTALTGERGGDIVLEWWVFPTVVLLTWSPKNNKTTWLPTWPAHRPQRLPHFLLYGRTGLGTRVYYWHPRIWFWPVFCLEMLLVYTSRPRAVLGTVSHIRRQN